MHHTVSTLFRIYVDVLKANDFHHWFITAAVLIPPIYNMMTSSNGNIFRFTAHLCGKFTGPQRNPRTKASDAELVFFDLHLNKRLSNQSWGWWLETTVTQKGDRCGTVETNVEHMFLLNHNIVYFDGEEGVNTSYTSNISMQMFCNRWCYIN